MVGNNFRPLSSSMVAWSFRLVRARTVPCSTKYGMVGTSFRPFPSSTVAMVLAPGASPRCRMYVEVHVCTAFLYVENA